MPFNAILPGALFLRLQELELMVGNALVDNGLDYGVNLRALAIVGWADVVYAVVADKGVHLGALALVLRIIDSNRVASKVLDKAHTRDISCTITHINHT